MRAVVPSSPAPVLRDATGRNWRIENVGDIELDGTGGVTRLHVTLIPLTSLEVT